MVQNVGFRLQSGYPEPKDSRSQPATWSGRRWKHRHAHRALRQALLAGGQNVKLLDGGHSGVSIALSGAAGENLDSIVAEAAALARAVLVAANAGEISAASALDGRFPRSKVPGHQIHAAACSTVQARRRDGLATVLKR